jgi:energy-coupling factor transport system ATP-binding protein
VSSIVRITDVSFAYPSPLPGHGPVPALQHVSLEIESGSFVALIGAVGAGKTTLCLCLNGIVPSMTGGEFAGAVEVMGMRTSERSVAELARHVGMVFEEAEVQLFNSSVEDEIAFGLEELGWEPPAIEERIDWALEAVGLQGMRRRNPRGLSGGEQKRLAIATVLAMAPNILVLDEPTAGLDPRGRQEVMQVISRLAKERTATVIMATQDAEMAARFADRVILLDEGRIVDDGTPREVYGRLAAGRRPMVYVPQMARAARLLNERLGRRWDFLTPEEALQALAPMPSQAPSSPLPHAGACP